MSVRCHSGRNRVGAALLGATLALAGASRASAQPLPASAPTYAKDVAPIFQRSCQACHRPGQSGPFSLMSYADARPWARAIKTKVSGRQMPPWHIDRRIGIQRFKDDYSLSDGEIATIVKWVDAGAPQGNPKDLPAPRDFSDDDRWHIGKPDLVVTSTAFSLPAAGPDLFPNIVVDPGLTEDRYIKAIEVKPTPRAKSVVHHLLVYSLPEVRESDAKDGDTEDTEDTFLAEYAQGKNGDMFPDGAGKLLKAGSKIKFSNHLHPNGEAITDAAQVAFVFYPKGTTPRHVIYSEPMGGANGQRIGVDLDIPPGQIVRHDGYTRLALPAKMTAFQPHLHTRGRRQCVEAIYPDDTQEVLNCSNFDFGWHIVYNYEDDAAPLLPAGTIVHVISWHDNTPWRGNPDPSNWVGVGARTIDEMSFSWISWYDLTEQEYQQELAARKAGSPSHTGNNQQ
jgi:mono/diheme cytochrome c family protein